MQSRRQFLKQSSLISLAPVVPAFISNAAMGAKQPNGAGRILVVIQLSGGNDGINTVVPFRDEGYAKNRKSLRLPEKDLIKLDHDIAFHPRMRSASELFQDGRLSVVQGVGYPNPNRSHFESMDIWHTARVDALDRASGNGWLGDAISVNPPTSGAHAVHVGKSDLPVALRGRRCTATSLSDLADLQLAMPDVALRGESATKSGSLADFVGKSVTDAYASASELAESTKSDKQAQYPSSALARRLKVIGQVIKSGVASQVYYTSQNGYDTHASQLQSHANLLGTLSSSLKAFMNDMRESGLADRVLVMAFSEFGRRVEENGSSGTDHGTAGPVMLAGTKLSSRIYGQTPSLLDLDSGDLKYSTDFRHVYASILSEWLQLKRPETLQAFGMTESLVSR